MRIPWCLWKPGTVLTNGWTMMILIILSWYLGVSTQIMEYPKAVKPHIWGDHNVPEGNTGSFSCLETTRLKWGNRVHLVNTQPGWLGDGLEPWALKKKLRGWDQASWCMDGWDQLSVKFSPVEIQNHQMVYSEVDVGYHIGILPYWSVFLPGHELNLGRSTIKDSWYQPLRDIGGESHHTGDVIVVLVFQSQIHSTAGRLICHVRCASLPMLGYTEESGRYWLRVCLPAFWDLNLSFLMTWDHNALGHHLVPVRFM